MSVEDKDGKNYESLYNNLKEEYEQSQKDNDEICKEYESTIQLLTESVESLKKEKKDWQLKLTKIENEQKAFKKEKDTLIKKNKDKMIDIQCLSEQNDKLNELIRKLKEEKSIFDTKIVTMENDIDHYENKIREYEDFIDELKAQLEDALEENITLQTEFETYKLNTGDQLLRKDEELREIRNDMTNKEKLLQRFTKPTDRFNIQKLQEKLSNDKNIVRFKRRYTISQKNIDLKFRNSKKHKTRIGGNEEDNIGNKKEKTKNKANKNDLNVILEVNDYKKAFTTTKQKQNEEEDSNNNPNNISNSNIGISYQNSQKNIPQILSFNDDNDESNDNIVKDEKNEKINEEQESKVNETKVTGLTSIIKKQFGELVICKENKLYVNPFVKNLLTKEQIKEFRISLRNMLIRIKQRKNNLNEKKISINEKLEKMGFRNNLL